MFIASFPMHWKYENKMNYISLMKALFKHREGRQLKVKSGVKGESNVLT